MKNSPPYHPKKRELLSADEFMSVHNLEVDDLFLLAARNALPSITLVNGKPRVSQAAAFEWRTRQALETL